MNLVELGIKENITGELILVNTSTNTLVLNQLYALNNELESGTVTQLVKITEDFTPENGFALLSITGDAIVDKTVFHKAVLKPVTILPKEV